MSIELFLFLGFLSLGIPVVGMAMYADDKNPDWGHYFTSCAWACAAAAISAVLAGALMGWEPFAVFFSIWWGAETLLWIFVLIGIAAYRAGSK